MNQKCKCLVTGATGYLGTPLVGALVNAGHSVTALVLPGDDAKHIAPYAQVRYADVCDPRALEREVVGFDVVIHLAGMVEISSRNRALVRRVNIEGTTNVAKLCLDHHMKLIYCSSVHAIPCLPKGEAMREIDDFDPGKVKGLYGKTKAEATRRVLEMTKRGLDAMVAFPSGMIGPGEHKLSNIGQMILDFLTGNLKAYTQGRYNFVDVRDVADGICAMVGHWASGQGYILSGHEVTVEQMIFAVAKASGLKPPRVKLPYWFVYGTSYLSELYYFILKKKPLFTPYSIQTLGSNCHFSNRKACQEIGFHARPPEESLSEMTQWIIQHFSEKGNGRYRPCGFQER